MCIYEREKERERERERWFTGSVDVLGRVHRDGSDRVQRNERQKHPPRMCQEHAVGGKEGGERREGRGERGRERESEGEKEGGREGGRE